MKNISTLFLVLVVLAIVFQSVQAAATPPPDTTPPPAMQPAGAIAGFPWGLLLVFIVAGFIMTYIKKNSPNKITSTSCVPLIDEKKMEAEKKMIAEEEASRKKP
jgi:hypothetical protein